ncbi:MAG: hypothetical protein ABSF15_23050 [Candidatus Sulfotelmatobacter sp.]|jgi:hypothetical protein
MAGEIFDRLDVAVYGSLSVITTLEFFEHHFAKVGHRLAPYDPTLSFTPLLPTLHTRKRLPQSGFVETGFKEINSNLLQSRRLGTNPVNNREGTLG